MFINLWPLGLNSKEHEMYAELDSMISENLELLEKLQKPMSVEVREKTLLSLGRFSKDMDAFKQKYKSEF